MKRVESFRECMHSACYIRHQRIFLYLFLEYVTFFSYLTVVDYCYRALEISLRLINQFLRLSEINSGFELISASYYENAFNLLLTYLVFNLRFIHFI